MKNVLIATIVGLALIGCQPKTETVIVKGEKGETGARGADGSNGVDGSNGADGKDGVSCTVADEFDGEKKIGVRITCGTTSSVVLNGENGEDGLSVTIGEASESQCPAGGILVNSTPICNGEVGEAGPQGIPGVQGPSGTDASSTSIVQLCGKEYGIKIGTSVYAVFHQELASEEEVPTTGVITPGNSDKNSHYHEVVITLNTSNTFLALLEEGVVYQSTDGSSCEFSVDSSGNVER